MNCSECELYYQNIIRNKKLIINLQKNKVLARDLTIKELQNTINEQTETLKIIHDNVRKLKKILKLTNNQKLITILEE